MQLVGRMELCTRWSRAWQGAPASTRASTAPKWGSNTRCRHPPAATACSTAAARLALSARSIASLRIVGSTCPSVSYNQSINLSLSLSLSMMITMMTLMWIGCCKCSVLAENTEMIGVFLHCYILIGKARKRVEDYIDEWLSKLYMLNLEVRWINVFFDGVCFSGWHGNVERQNRGIAMAPIVEGGMSR